MQKPEYKIHIEDDVVTVTVLGEEYVKGFYFGTDMDPQGTAQELYDLLKTAGVEVEISSFQADVAEG